MIIWLCTDMEGLAGIDSWDQCYHPSDTAPEYLDAREQLTLEVNAAVAGCFDAGATEVRVIDGHGRNRNQGFIREKLDPRVRLVWFSSFAPVRLDGLNETVHAVAMIGQHAMAGTLHAFLDHTQAPKEICRLRINGQEHGEMSQFALYAGAYGVPLAYVSGDEALCEEARRLFPHVTCTPTKRGTGWATCELYPPDDVRQHIRRDIARAIRRVDRSSAWRLPTPIEVSVEWAYSGLADQRANFAGVQRIDARTIAWKIGDPRDIYSFPSEAWQPGVHG